MKSAVTSKDFIGHTYGIFALLVYCFSHAIVLGHPLGFS